MRSLCIYRGRQPVDKDGGKHLVCVGRRLYWLINADAAATQKGVSRLLPCIYP